MHRVWAVSFSAPEAITLGLAGVLVILVALYGYRRWQRLRISPEERERRRRETLVAYGKMGDATLVEMGESLLFYSYDVRGVQYVASQDVTYLAPYLPREFAINAPVSVKYDPRNPANSIIVAEKWTGLRGKASA